MIDKQQRDSVDHLRQRAQALFKIGSRSPRADDRLIGALDVEGWRLFLRPV